MVAVVGGLGAAVLFATTTIASSRGARIAGTRSFLAGVMLVGAVVVVPLVAVRGVPAGLDAAAAGWLLLSGGGNVAGLLLTYAALRIGKVGLVAPIVSTEGAIAAVISVTTGESLSAGAAATLVVIAAGILLASRAEDGVLAPPEERTGRAALLSVVAAVSFGASLYATGHVSAELPIVWVLLPARVIGVAAVALPLVASRQLRLSRGAAPFVVVSGLCEVGGFASFALAARHGLAVSAVLASQFAALAALAAFVLFHERLARVQVAGVVAVVVGVGVLSGLQA